MATLTKTEQKLLDRASKKGFTGYHGKREANAALSLQAKGVVKITNLSESHKTRYMRHSLLIIQGRIDLV